MKIMPQVPPHDHAEDFYNDDDQFQTEGDLIVGEAGDNFKLGINNPDPQATIDVANVTEDGECADLINLESDELSRHNMDHLGNTKWNVAMLEEGLAEVGLIEHTTFEGCPCLSMWTEMVE